MNLTESQDPTLKRLLDTSEQHKREVERELKSIKQSADQMLQKALIIGGAMAVTYLVVSACSGNGKKKKKAVVEKEIPTTSVENCEAPNLVEQFGTKLIDSATVMILELVREKLHDFLNPKKE